MKAKTYESPTEETYSELQSAYDFFNKTLFYQTLPPCLITLQRHGSYYGYFSLGIISDVTLQLTDNNLLINTNFNSIFILRV